MTPTLSLGKLRCEYLVNSLGIDTQTPRLSWIVKSKENVQAQSAYQQRTIAERVAGLLALWRHVPTDFTAFLAEDYDRLPDTVHLYARSVGVGLVHWWRNYWLLRSIDEIASQA